MKFQLSSPDSLMFDRKEFTRKRNDNERIFIGLLGLIAVGAQIATFVLLSNMIQSM